MSVYLPIHQLIHSTKKKMAFIHHIPEIVMPFLMYYILKGVKELLCPSTANNLHRLPSYRGRWVLYTVTTTDSRSVWFLLSGSSKCSSRGRYELWFSLIFTCFAISLGGLILFLMKRIGRSNSDIIKAAGIILLLNVTNVVVLWVVTCFGPHTPRAEWRRWKLRKE